MTAKADFTCPHCGGQVSTKIIPLKPKRRHRPTFNHVAPLPSNKFLRGPLGLLAFLRGQAHPHFTNDPSITVKVEEIPQNGNDPIRFYEFDPELVEWRMLRNAADIVIGLGLNWSRPTFCDRGFTQTEYHKLTDEFKRLNLLFVKKRRSVLTLRGMALLRSVYSY